MFLSRQFKFIILSFGIFFLVAACHKESLKEPVSVNITIDMNRLSDPFHSYHFEEGVMLIQSIRLLGDRVEGQDIDFLREFPDGLFLSMNGQIHLDDLGFDLPQGEYDSLNLEIVTGNNQNTNLKIEGEFVSPLHSADTMALIFEVAEPVTFTWKVQNGNGYTISLNSVTNYQLQVHMDPIYWFENISYQLLDAADSVFVDNVNTIPINNNENIPLYTIIKKQMENGNRAFF